MSTKFLVPPTAELDRLAICHDAQQALPLEVTIYTTGEAVFSVRCRARHLRTFASFQEHVLDTLGTRLAWEEVAYSTWNDLIDDGLNAGTE